jgi:hypothetical protein
MDDTLESDVLSWDIQNRSLTEKLKLFKNSTFSSNNGRRLENRYWRMIGIQKAKEKTKENSEKIVKNCSQCKVELIGCSNSAVTCDMCTELKNTHSLPSYHQQNVFLMDGGQPPLSVVQKNLMEYLMDLEPISISPEMYIK